jgi:hypothetical protein
MITVEWPVLVLRVVHFDQTHHSNARQTFRRVGLRRVVQERIMAIPMNYKHKEYARYAAHCLNIMSTTKDQDARAINREMATEWLKLADAVLHPLKRMN